MAQTTLPSQSPNFFLPYKSKFSLGYLVPQDVDDVS